MSSEKKKGFTHHPFPTNKLFDEDIDFVHSSYSFPEKLFFILENSTIECARWSETGICFRVTDEEEFMNQVMPKYFKQTKITSFQRQLNSYGFRKILRGVDSGCYFHPKFRKDRFDLLVEVERLPPKGSLETYDDVLFAMKNLFDSDERHKKIKSKSIEKLPNKGPMVPVSSASSNHNVTDDSSLSSLSSGDQDTCQITPSLAFAPRYKGPYLFLGCRKPICFQQEEDYMQYSLYEQHCMNYTLQVQEYSYAHSDDPIILPAILPKSDLQILTCPWHKDANLLNNNYPFSLNPPPREAALFVPNHNIENRTEPRTCYLPENEPCNFPSHSYYPAVDPSILYEDKERAFFDDWEETFLSIPFLSCDDSHII